MFSVPLYRREQGVVMNSLAYWAFAYLPEPVQRPVVSTGAFLRSLLRLVRGSRVKAQLIEGTRAGFQLRVLWAGQGPFREYLLPRLFPNGFTVLESVGVNHTTLLNLRGGLVGQCDLIAVERNRLLSPLVGFRRILPHVRMGLDFQQQRTLNSNTRHRRDQVRSRVADGGVEFRDYQVQDAPEMLSRFYHELYAPHIAAQFGRHNVESFSAMRAYYPKALLRLGFQNGILISGILFMIVDRALVFCKYGVRNSKDPVHRAAASIFLHLDYAKARGYQAYDAFHGRPFFEDGVFRYKRGCGLDVRAERCSVYWDEELYLRILRLSPGVLDFLRSEPHLRLCEDGSLAACLCPAAKEDMVGAVIEEYQQRRTPGIGRYEFLVSRTPSAEEEVRLRDGCGQPTEPFIFIEYKSVSGCIK